MALNFKIKTSKVDNERIVIRMSGDFDGSSAWELIHKMNEYSETYEVIEVDTDGLKELIPFGRSTFMSHGKSLRQTPSRFVVTGGYAPYFSELSLFEPVRL